MVVRVRNSPDLLLVDERARGLRLAFRSLLEGHAGLYIPRNLE